MKFLNEKGFLIYAVLFKYAHGSMTGPEYHSFQNVFSPIKICMHICHVYCAM